MRPRLSRRAVLIAGPLLLAGLLALFSFGPIVRAVARGRAARRHVDLGIRAVRPGWFAVRLLGVVVRPEGMPDVLARIDEVRVGLGFFLRVEQLELHGGAVEAHGDLDRLREEFEAWRSLGPAPGSAPPAASGPRVVVDAMSLRWQDMDAAEPKAVAEGIGAVWDSGRLRWSVATGHARLGFFEASLVGGEGEADRGGVVSRARAAALTITIDRAAESATAERIPSTPPAPPPPLAAPAPAANPAAPLLVVPDLHGLRTKVVALAFLLSDRIREGADIGVDALTWKIARPHEPVPFTLGPGPLALTRTPSATELRFSTDPHVASTPLAVRALLPRQGDASISLEGGPVSLSLLGVQEGAAGLLDVAHATTTGRAHVILADDGSAVTFDGEGGVRGLSLSNPRLATDVVQGLDLQVQARGAATAEGDLRLDDLEATFGAVHIVAGGVLEQRPDHVAAALHFEVPRAHCQSLLDSLPVALLPALQGTRFAGDLSAHGRFGFDTRSLDDLQLDYDVKDQCRETQVPPELARERFMQPFTHRIYLPDGSIADELTGPGSDDWTPLDEISPYMQVAVLTTEDGGFPKHHGFNRASIRSSIIANLKARRFARGASTITMQLAKNLFLARDKTLSRKLEEVVLTDYLEQTFSKDELMELYLNVIEFGPAVYGITAASEHYFGRTPAELKLGECLFLSSLLPAPLRYGAMRENGEVPEGWMRMLRSLMQIAHHYGRITDAELAEAEKEPVVFWRGGDRPPPRAPVRARTPIDGETDDVITAPPLDSPSP
ncbi:MAG TPA: biosynthetic peptidoglycan transglycosylase [Polyangiaceae bacterium]|nr:biosynthetic peptidoglycan transglycosylase [Polyangiaceae bacterium]